jgi:hypothetical protein
MAVEVLSLQVVERASLSQHLQQPRDVADDLLAANTDHCEGGCTHLGPYRVLVRRMEEDLVSATLFVHIRAEDGTEEGSPRVLEKFLSAVLASSHIVSFFGGG